MTADTVLAVRDAPDRNKPFVQTKRRIFEDRADFVAELLAASLFVASQHAAGFDFSNLFAAAFRTDDLSVWPLDLLHVLIAHIDVSEVFYSLDQGCWCVAHGSA